MDINFYELLAKLIPKNNEKIGVCCNSAKTLRKNWENVMRKCYISKKEILQQNSNNCETGNKINLYNCQFIVIVGYSIKEQYTEIEVCRSINVRGDDEYGRKKLFFKDKNKIKLKGKYGLVQLVNKIKKKYHSDYQFYILNGLHNSKISRVLELLTYADEKVNIVKKNDINKKIYEVYSMEDFLLSIK